MKGLLDGGHHRHEPLKTMAALQVESILNLEPICQRNLVTLFILKSL